MTPHLTYIGRDLSRPESVLTTQSGDIFCSHGAHGVARICPDGRQFALAPDTEHGGLPVLANGIALRRDGSFLVANIADGGGLMELDSAGMRLFHPCSDTGTAPPVNFVLVDELGKTWITVSSTDTPRSLAYNQTTRNGYVACIDDQGFRIVLDGRAYTNEIRTDYENGWLYIAETMGQKISRIRLDETGIHGEPDLFAQMPPGAFVDGIEIDSEGAVLAVCIISSEVIRITPDGAQQLIVGERVAEWVDKVQAEFEAGQLGRPHLDTSPTQHLRNVSSLAFCGNALDEMVLGNLLDQKLPCLPAPVRGRTPPHWSVTVPLYGTEF